MGGINQEKNLQGSNGFLHIPQPKKSLQICFNWIMFSLIWQLIYVQSVHVVAWCMCLKLYCQNLKQYHKEWTWNNNIFLNLSLETEPPTRRHMVSQNNFHVWLSFRSDSQSCSLVHVQFWKMAAFSKLLRSCCLIKLLCPLCVFIKKQYETYWEQLSHSSIIVECI